MLRSGICVALSVMILLSLSACPQDEGTQRFSKRQQEVYDAMQAWSKAAAAGDTTAMWEMLSANAQLYYELELAMPGGPRAQAAVLKAALDPDAILEESERARIERDLAKLPEDVATMTPAAYYAWQLRHHPQQGDQLTQERIDAQVRLWHQSNVEDIRIEEHGATIELKSGDPRRYHWVNEAGDWKFDLMPSMLRQLEDWKRQRD